MDRKKETYYYVLSNRGFGSEINNLLYAIYFCERKGYSLSVISSGWNCTIEKGWHDYFDSLLPEQTLISPRFRILKSFERSNLLTNNYISNSRLYKRIIKFIKLRVIGNKYLLTGESKSFGKMRVFCATERNNNHDSFYASIQKILNDIWIIKPELLKTIQQRIPPDKEYIAIHIRRGDKVKTGEDFKYEIQEYIEVLFQLNLKTKTIFLMGDDFSTLEELRKKLPNHKIITLMNESRLGHHQDIFNSKSLHIKREEVIDLITEIEIARHSMAFIGSFNSNLFRLIEYFKLDNCFDISKGRNLIGHPLEL